MKTFKKVFSCTLIGISFILLFTSWTLLTPQAKTAATEYYNQIFPQEEKETNFGSMIRKLQAVDLDDYLKEESSTSANEKFVEAIYKDSEFRVLVAALADGGLDVSQTSLAARTIKDVYEHMYEQKDLFNITDEVSYLKNTGALALYNVVVTVLFILAILLATATFLVRLFDRFAKFRKYDLVFFIVQLLLFIMTVIFVGSINSFATGFPILGISLWGIIAVILACPSLFLERIPFEKAEIYAGRGTLVNDTAYVVGGTVSKTMDRISTKMDETTQIVRLTRELKAGEDQLDETFKALGQKYYEAHEDDAPETLRDTFQEIRDLKDRIAHVQKEIDTVNNVVACEHCGTRWTAGTKFCANCGTKLPNITEEREEYDFEMKQKKEKKAGKSFCKYCGAKVEDDDDFCPGCGRSI